MNRLSIISGIALIGAIALAVAAGPVDQKGGQGMFGLFGGKKSAETATVVAPEVGATLQTQSAWPQASASAPAESKFECEVAELRGHAPDGEWVSEAISGETQHVYIIPSAAGRPSLAILADSHARMQVWELSKDHPARFLKQRPVRLGAGQESWVMHFALNVVCLPGQQVAVAINYTGPAMKQALYLYSPDSNEFRRVDDIESEKSGPPPYSSFETLAVSATTKLITYRTGLIRLGAGNYAYQHNHILLFSPDHAQGLEVLKLNLDDGNLREWMMQGKTLWLRTHDKRKQPNDFTWSLDLHRVL